MLVVWISKAASKSYLCKMEKIEKKKRIFKRKIRELEIKWQC